jgi:hypothetical protein
LVRFQRSPGSLDAAIRSARLPIDDSVPAIEAIMAALAAPVEALVDAVAASIEALFDAVALRIEPLRAPFEAVRVGPGAAAIEAMVDAIAATVEPHVDAVATVVETVLHPVATVATVGRRRPGGADQQEECSACVEKGLHGISWSREAALAGRVLHETTRERRSG